MKLILPLLAAVFYMEAASPPKSPLSLASSHAKAVVDGPSMAQRLKEDFIAVYKDIEHPEAAESKAEDVIADYVAKKVSEQVQVLVRTETKKALSEIRPKW